MLYEFPKKDIKLILSLEPLSAFFEKKMDHIQFINNINGLRDDLTNMDVSEKSITKLIQASTDPRDKFIFIRLFGGARNNRVEHILAIALEELSKLHHIIIVPVLGGTDIEDYNLVKELSGKNYHPRRGQVDAQSLVNDLVKSPGFKEDKFSVKLVLLDYGLFTPTSNFCLGGSFPISENPNNDYNDVVVISTYGIHDDVFLLDLFFHELGHLLGAAPDRRENTEIHLGSHCTNPLCVMEQKMEGLEGVERAHQRRNLHLPIFCNQCIKDIMQYSKKYPIRHLITFEL